MSERRELAIGFVPAIFGTTALTLSLIATIGCKSIKFNSDQDNAPALSFGIWCYDTWEVVQTDNGQIVTRDECKQYPDGVDMDAKWKTAMAFSIITPVIGGILVIWNWMAPCLDSSVNIWRKAGMIYYLCALCQGLTLLFLSSDACNDNPLLIGTIDTFYPDDCKFNWGIRCNISAVVFWFAAGVSMMRGYKRALRSEASKEADVTEGETTAAAVKETPEEEQALKEGEEPVKEQVVENA